MSQTIQYDAGYDPNKEEPAAWRFIICLCQRKLYVPDFTNECECGRLWNWAGQELRPESEWDKLLDEEG